MNKVFGDNAGSFSEPVVETVIRPPFAPPQRLWDGIAFFSRIGIIYLFIHWNTLESSLYRIVEIINLNGEKIVVGNRMKFSMLICYALIFFIGKSSYCQNNLAGSNAKMNDYVKFGVVSENHTDYARRVNGIIVAISPTKLKSINGSISIELHPFSKAPVHCFGFQTAYTIYSYYDMGAGTIQESISERRIELTLLYFSSYRLLKIAKGIEVKIGPLSEISYCNSSRIIGVSNNKNEFMFSPYFCPEIDFLLLQRFSFCIKAPAGFGISLLRQSTNYADKTAWDFSLGSGASIELKYSGNRHCYGLFYSWRDRVPLASIAESITNMHHIQIGTSIPFPNRAK